MAEPSEDLSYEDFLDLVRTSDGSPGPDGRYDTERTLDKIHGKWKVFVLYSLFQKGTCRFNELQRILPQVSRTMLSSTLKELETDGLLTRTQFNEVPPHTEYSLTEAGRGLMRVFYELYKWQLKYC